MKITSNNETLAENKVLILYILSNVQKPITNDALYSIILSATNLNYFYFQQFLLDLIEAKYIISYENENQTVYQITPKGKETLDLTIDILPGIIKLKVDTTFKTNIEHIENAESIVAEFNPKSETEYEVTCKIVENGETVFSIKTLAYSRDQAQNIVENWRKNAGELYPQLIDLMTKK